MKIFVFKNDEEWIEYPCNNFDSFLNDIIKEECIFKFVDCTEKEIDTFFEDLEYKLMRLDNEDYYCHRLNTNTIKDTYIFIDLVLYTLDEVIRLRQRQLNYYRELREKI